VRRKKCPKCKKSNSVKKTDYYSAEVLYYNCKFCGFNRNISIRLVERYEK